MSKGLRAQPCDPRAFQKVQANHMELEQPQGVVSRLQAAEFGGQLVLLLLQLLHLKSVPSEALLNLVGVFVVLQLALKAAVRPLQLGQLKRR